LKRVGTKPPWYRCKNSDRKRQNKSGELVQNGVVAPVHTRQAAGLMNIVKPRARLEVRENYFSVTNLL
jgi:hypothetical protein